MKKFRLAVLAAVVCTAALLTSCIKEESYEVSTAYLDVTLSTRATSTQQQGDGITDVMLWAFKCSIDPNTKLPNSVESKASGWRTVTGLNVYQNIGPIHMPLPLCDNGSQNYVIVAVINKGQFGRIIDRTAAQETVDGVTRYPTLALNANTTYSQLINASFDAAAYPDGQSQTWWWTNYVNDDGKTPTHMPVSHWATVSVSNTNTHPNNCAEVQLDVFRAVAKAQLFMTKASDFDLEVVEAKLSYTKMPVEGVLLSGLLADNLKTAAPTPAWLGTTVPREEDWGNATNLKTQNGDIILPAEGDTHITPNTVEVTNVGTNSFQFVGSTFMHESKEVCQQTNTSYGEGSVTVDTGYYLEIGYKINGERIPNKYVAIPYAVVRNHDYQIKATVKNDGGVVVDYTVANWEKVEWNLAFDAAQNSELLPLPNEPDENSTPTAPAEVSYTLNQEEGAAVFFFKMDGPDGITWKPAILNASQDHYITRVYEVKNISTDTEGKITYELSSTPIVGDIEAESNKYYCIKVVALDADAHANRTEPIKLGVTHAPQWNEEKSNLLVVNPKTTNGYFWPGKDANGASSKTVGDELMVYIYPKH